LDPLLKAADEVVGKLHSLAIEDFKNFGEQAIALNPISDKDFGGLIYLFGRFWAQIEIMRQDGSHRGRISSSISEVQVT
jgi:hypothetical protein